MARKILFDTAYTFTPSTKTIVIPRYIPKEKLILITNVTSNTVIYNFSDPTLTATGYSAQAGQASWGGAGGTTTITLNYNTGSMSATDKLQIMVDEYEERFRPAEDLMDATNKLRTTTPQSLIDTDFEYSFQPTKWEFFQQQNWNASVYTSTSNSVLAATYGGAGFSVTAPTITVSTNVATVSGLTMPQVPYAGSYVYIVDATNSNNFPLFRYSVNSGATTSSFTFNVTLANGTYTPQMVVLGGVPGTAANPSYAAWAVSNNITASGINLQAGGPVLAQDTQNEPYCDGTFVVAYVNQTQGAFAYFPKVNQKFNQNQLQKPQTSLYVGGYYTQGYGIGSVLPLLSVIAGADQRTVTVTTASNHNLVPGAPIFAGATTATGANGPWYVQSVPTPNSFTYNVTNGGLTAGSILQSTTAFYVRPEGYQIQRSADGGIGIFAGNPVPGAQTLRQTRRYFRYQAGKGIQYSTAATFKPNQDIVSISVSGNIATITTDQDHGLNYGAMVNLRNIAATNPTDLATYNGTYSVSPIVPLSARTFGVVLSGTPGDINPGCGMATVETADAKGFTVRCGLFDDMNGFFYEFDGTYLNAVRRNGTTVMRGVINVCTGSSLVIGTGSQYTRQTQPGDKVIIRGQVYEVSQVINDNVLHIAPAYRAATPGLASGTSGIPFATVQAGAGTTQTINISTSTTATQVTVTGIAGASGVGVVGAYQMQGTIARATNTTLSATANLNATTITVASATSIVPGMLVVITGAGNLPANTFVASSYVVGSTTVPLTQGISTTTNSGTVVEFYYSPASGMNISGVGIPNGTQVSGFSNVGGTGGASITIQVFVNQAITATVTASSYLVGNIPGFSGTTGYTTQTSVIALATTYGIAPGMIITGTGIPGNCIVAGLAASGVGVVLNQPISTTVANTTSLTFAPNLTLYAIQIPTSGATSASSTTITLANVNGIQIGSFVTGSASIPLNSFVTAINTSTNTVTIYTPYASSQGTTGIIATNTTLTFGSRIFVYNTSQTAANGMWPVTAVTGTTISFATSASISGNAIISTYGQTKVFGEDVVVKKYQVREIRTPAYQFNLDTFDGTGPSGFNADLTKIQMIYIDYSWYGAGFIRWGARTAMGDIIYGHKVQHGNREYLAYQRSGNLPGRFEAANFPARTPITAVVPSTGYTMGATPVPGTISLYDASRFMIPGSSNYGQQFNGEVNIEGEIFYYTGVAAAVTANTTGNTAAVTQSTAYPWGVPSTAAPWAIGATGLTSVATVGSVTVVNGSITAVTLTSGGAGYTSAPPVTIGGGNGAGAQIRAVVVNGAVTQLVVTNGGTGYTSTPTVLIGANQLTGCYRESSVVSSVGTFTGTTTVGSNQITGVSTTTMAQLFVGCLISANTNFSNINAKIVGISGTTIYVDQVATVSGSTSFTLVNRGSATAAQHNAYNTGGLPLANAYNTVCQLSPNVQHWGVSAIMDGRYDTDKSYVFTTPRQTAAVVQANSTAPLISIRVSPTASNGFARNFGVRDVVMRMQANLYQMDVFNSGPFLITVKYNCASAVFTPALWTANVVGSGSLSQVIYHNPSDIVTGGDVVVAFYANASGGTYFTDTSADLSIVKDLGNSVYGGDGVFPDGPDVVTIFATNLSTTTAQALFARISWTEAQA